MRNPSLLLALALLAAGQAMAARQSGSGLEGSYLGSGGPGPGGTTQVTVRDVGERLDRDVQRYAEIQSKFGLQNVPEAASAMNGIQNLISQARQALSNGNPQLALNLCFLLENRIAELGMFGNRNSLDRARTGEGGSFDSSRLRQDRQIAAEYNIQRVADRLAYLTQRLESAKNPQAADFIDKVRDLLDAARREAQAGRYANVPTLLSQADPLLNDLQRLQQANLETDQHVVTTGPSRDPKEQQPGAQAAMAQADEIYQRVYNSAQRLGERPSSADDAKAASLRTRVFDLLEKAKEALANGQSETAKEYCLKAESLLAEWHRSLSAADNKLSSATRDRVKAKLDRASDLVSASGNDKAAKILEKSREHFDRAERAQSEGQAARAEIEMDLALKLAAKAVDISRSGSR